MPDPIVSYTEQMTREEPYMEAMRRGLLQDVRGLQANRFGYNLVDQKDAAGAVLKDEFGYPIQSYEKIMDDAGHGDWRDLPAKIPTVTNSPLLQDLEPRLVNSPRAPWLTRIPR
mgnify:CR=1 FL=1